MALVDKSKSPVEMEPGICVQSIFACKLLGRYMVEVQKGRDAGRHQYLLGSFNFRGFL